MDWNRFAMEWAQSSLSACWLLSCFRRLEALLRVNGLQVFVDELLSGAFLAQPSCSLPEGSSP